MYSGGNVERIDVGALKVGIALKLTL